MAVVYRIKIGGQIKGGVPISSMPDLNDYIIREKSSADGSSYTYVFQCGKYTCGWIQSGPGGKIEIEEESGKSGVRLVKELEIRSHGDTKNLK